MRKQRIVTQTLIVAGLLLSISLSAVAADISGKWDAVVELGSGRSGSVVFTFQQNGEQLTGTYSGALGERPITGTVKGDEVRFTVGADRDEQEMKLEYTGKIVSPNSIKGEAQYGQAGKASWSATRK